MVCSHTIQCGLTLKLDLFHIQSYNTTWFAVIQYNMVCSHTIQQGLTLKFDLSQIQSYNTTWFDTQA